MRTWIHGPRILRGARFGAFTLRFERETVEARKAAYLRMLYLAAAGDEEIIAAVNGLIRREVDPSARAGVLLALGRRWPRPQAERLVRALLPLAEDANLGSMAGAWMHRHVFGKPPAADAPAAKIRADLFYELYAPPSPPNVATISAKQFEAFCRRCIDPAGDEFPGAQDVRRRAGSPPSVGRIVEMAAVADGLLRSPLMASVSVDPMGRLDLYLYRLCAVGRQWLLDELKATPAFDVRRAVSDCFKRWFIDDSRLDPHAFRVIAAAEYLQMFDEQTVGRMIQLLRRVVGSARSPGARRLFDSAVEYLKAASGIRESFDFDVPLRRSTAHVTFSRWFDTKFGTAP